MRGSELVQQQPGPSGDGSLVASNCRKPLSTLEVQPAQSQNQGKGGAAGLSVNASMSMNNAHMMLNMAAGAPGATGQATANSSQLAQHKAGPYKNFGASGPLQGGSANRRK